MHVYDTELDHPMVDVCAWLPSRLAVQVNDHVWRSAGNSSSFVIAGDDGDVVLNTGTAYQGPRFRERYEQAIGRPLRVRKVIFTQSLSLDHIGGWQVFDDPGVERIAQERFFDLIEQRRRISGYIRSRPTATMFARRTVEGEPVTEEPEGTRAVRPADMHTLIKDAYSFEVSGRRFEVFSAPGGESLDGLVVWLPEERTVFTGNLTFAVPGGLPHLTTIRGDRMRSILTFLDSLDRVIALQAETWCNGHGPHIEGAAQVAEALGKVRDAAQFLHDETVKGMNEGKDLFTLMREIALPPELQPAHSRGPASWCVRAIFEEYVGWFRGDSATELTGVPPSSVWADLAELAGGPDLLADRAAAHLDQGEPEQALHLTDIALSVDPRHRHAREVELGALEAMLERSGAVNWDDARYLEWHIGRLRADLDSNGATAVRMPAWGAQGRTT